MAIGAAYIWLLSHGKPEFLQFLPPRTPRFAENAEE
jgi:hypothetical protein